MEKAQKEDTFLGNLEKFKDQYAAKAAEGGAPTNDDYTGWDDSKID